ncbi:MAG: AraC family transcriptional regulator [Arcobacteraceae bacterium]
MHRKETSLHHSKLANNMLNYINKNIDTDINIDAIAFEYGMSKFHFHRIFKEQIGTNIYETIKSIRLQKASNLLITNKYSTITEIASMCGYSSQTSFIRAFKNRFEQTPKIWRNGGYKEYSNKIVNAISSSNITDTTFEHLEAKIIKTKPKTLYYIRHKGYSKKLSSIWQKMMAWVYTNNIENYEQIAIYHDNPIITPLDECQYIACVTVENDKKLKNTNLPSFQLDEYLCAAFEVEGKYGDILQLIQWVYHSWLPQSGFETTTFPSFSVFRKNHFLNDDGYFKVTYYVPVRYV